MSATTRRNSHAISERGKVRCEDNEAGDKTRHCRLTTLKRVVLSYRRIYPLTNRCAVTNRPPQ